MTDDPKMTEHEVNATVSLPFPNAGGEPAPAAKVSYPSPPNSTLPVIETPRLRLDCWRQTDWESFLPIAADPEVMRYVMRGQPWDETQVRQFIDAEIASQTRHGFCRFAVRRKSDDQLIGFCGLKQPSQSGFVEIGWRLGRAYWGQGYATEAARQVVQFAFATLGLPRLVAFIQLPNLPSRWIAEKLGMQYRAEVLRDDGIRRACYVLTNPQPRSPK